MGTDRPDLEGIAARAEAALSVPLIHERGCGALTGDRFISCSCAAQMATVFRDDLRALLDRCSQLEADVERLREAASKFVKGNLGRYCELTTDDGSDRCGFHAEAVKYEDGFLDEVCEKHAASAEARGALVIHREVVGHVV